MLADYQTDVDSLVRDRDSVITNDQRDAAINAAVTQYSADAPRSVVVDQAATTAGNTLDLPAGWTDDSVLVSAEYPIGQWPPVYLDASDVQIYASPTVRQLRLPVQLPGTLPEREPGRDIGIGKPPRDGCTQQAWLRLSDAGDDGPDTFQSFVELTCIVDVDSPRESTIAE